MAAAGVAPTGPLAADHARAPWSGCSPPAPPPSPPSRPWTRRGLLVRLVPEWAAVRNRPQRNAYHRFTVDRHLLEAAAQAAPLGRRRCNRPDLLLVGALLHDIGKGFPGDHTDAGVSVVGEMGHAAWAFAPERRGGPRRPRPQPPPARRRRHPTRPRRPRHRRGRGRGRAGPRPTRSSWPPSPKPTVWPPDRPPGASGRRAWWRTWCAAWPRYLAGGEVRRAGVARHRPAPRLHAPGRTTRSFGRGRRATQRHGRGP